MSVATADTLLGRAGPVLLRLSIALTAVVVLTSAFLRHAQSGAGCEPWPACYGRVAAAQRAGQDTPGVHAARTGHRIAATGVGLVVAGLVLFGWMRAETARSSKRLAMAALALVVALAALGAATEGARMPAVAIGNLLGGHGLLALLVALAALEVEGEALGARARPLAIVALVAAVAQPVLGGAIDAQHALPACASVAHCAEGSWSDFVHGESWNPFRNPQTTEGRFDIPPGAAGLFPAHGIGAVVFAGLAVCAALALRRSRPRCAAVLAIATLLDLALGVAAMGVHATRTIAVAHSALASVPIAALAAALGVRDRSTR